MSFDNKKDDMTTLKRFLFVVIRSSQILLIGCIFALTCGCPP